jgi:hypothetical protein
MGSNDANRRNNLDQYLNGFLNSVSDPVHKRILQAYQKGDPVGSMEAELARILREVLQGED